MNEDKHSPVFYIDTKKDHHDRGKFWTPRIHESGDEDQNPHDKYEMCEHGGKDTSYSKRLRMNARKS